MLIELAMHSALLGATFLAPPIIDQPAEPPACKLGQERTYSFEVASWGDTLQGFMDQVGAGPRAAQQVQRAVRRLYKIDNIFPHNHVDLGMSRGGVIRWFRYRPTLTAGVCAERIGRDTWKVSRVDVQIDRDVEVVELDGHPSLLLSIEDMDEDPSLADLIADLFPTKELQKIQLLVEKLSVEGQFLTYTRILGAQAIVAGKEMRAFYFEHADGRGGYYTENAVPLREIPLYRPVPHSFLVSTFGLRRHPIRHVKRAHKGIDFAAPMDTVVHAAANGTIVEARYLGPLGRMITIDHGRGLKTRYAHLNRYFPGIRPGVRVHRGQPIGHVGTTGLSTGAHLHFETLIDDEHVNPLRVTTPPPPAISDDLMPEFQKRVADMLKQLDLNGGAPAGA